MTLRRLVLIVVALVVWTVAVPVVAQDRVPAEDLADPDGQFIDIDGISVYYIERGPADGPAVLLLHGLGASTFSWRYTMDPLAEAGYRTIAFDRPPFGLADKDPEIDYSAPAMVELTRRLMDALEIETAALVGHSMGGGIIAYFAATYPDRINGLVFVDGAVRLPDELAEATPEPGAEDVDIEESVSPLSSVFEFASTLDPSSPGTISLVAGFLTPERYIDLLSSAYAPGFEVTEDIATGYTRVLQVEGWEAALLAFGAQRTTIPLDYDALAAVAVPVLIIWGEEDTWVPLAVGEGLSQLLPEANLVVYPGVGHMPMEENADAFNTDLLAFLEQVRQ